MSEAREWPDEITLSVETDMLDVTSLSEPDPVWAYTDENGHRHTRRKKTYRYIVDHEATDWYPEAGHHECIQCGVVIQSPGDRLVNERRYAPGLMAYYVNGQPVAREEYEAAHAEIIRRMEQST